MKLYTIKNQIKAKTRMISDKWTLEDIEELNIDKEFSKILQEQIDWDILVKSLILHGGWHKVILSKFDRLEVDAWCKEHICGKYESRGSTWVFKEEKDYILFLLRWS
jgi:hypothetical protein